MFFYKYKLNNEKIPMRVKVSLVLSILFGLTILALFAFTFFLVAIAAGVILFFLSLFRKPPETVAYYQKDLTTRHYRSNPKRDDDIIDI